jgi:hypothetical protein
MTRASLEPKRCRRKADLFITPLSGPIDGGGYPGRILAHHVPVVRGQRDSCITRRKVDAPNLAGVTMRHYSEWASLAGTAALLTAISVSAAARVSGIVLEGPSGGTGGSAFNDASKIPTDPTYYQLNVWHGSYIDGLQIAYSWESVALTYGGRAYSPA